ncbi:MAG: hypothetical protein A3F35_00685 [Candidatus Woykebacteria bacterium RIFCSPHIGHO2_12_FULL_45_10]|uniref:Uncharacterized protein n=1 Tax=Candidatus Woykebacteria bacterium RIFCSPHIGHO2_12_FULL_45_10 TaxID=1802603 RepID=A0A1G1WNE5_9BACT|nr:MAG: hypothetical protein A3F35_00685 [Candidatus Woykebacteria bacterium RIFCSPHIGHO2_12_FULL_45_10]
MPNLTKRAKIAISTVFLVVGLFLLPGMQPQYKVYSLVGLITLSYVLSAWSIFLDVSGLEFVTLFVLPVVLTASFGLFIFEFDPSPLLRALLSVTFGLVYYTILLAENIFNVSAERNIPLLRAANTVGYLTTLFVSFAVFSLLFSLGIDGYLFTIATFATGFFLLAQAFWQIKLEETDIRSLLRDSLVAALLLAEFAWILTFWPLPPAKLGLALAAMIYVLLGIIQHLIKEDLTNRSVGEYLFVALAVFLLLSATTSWGG